MIYLSRLQLNPFGRMAQSELAHLYQMHRTLLKAFGTDRQTSQVLHRIERNLHLAQSVILVQSAAQPDWTKLRDGYLLDAATKTIDIQLDVGSVFRFRLRACPSKKVRRYDESLGKRYNGNRHSTRYFFYREEDQINWLQKRGEHHGFDLLRLQVSQPISQVDHGIKLFSVQYDGILRITDATHFRRGWQTGIGPSKAFGCGLLSLAPT